MEFDYNQYFHETTSANGGQPVISSGGLFQTSSPTPTLEQRSSSSSQGHYTLTNLNANYQRAPIINNEHSQSTQISSENPMRQNAAASSSTASQAGDDDSLENNECTRNSKKRKLKKPEVQDRQVLSDDEIEQALDDEMNAYVELDERVREQEEQLLALKRQKNLNKKDLQVQRNRITAQLSRDRKILETEFMRKELLKLRRQVNDLHRDLHSGEFCSKCRMRVITKLDLEEPAPAAQEPTRVTREPSQTIRKRSSAGAINLGSGNLSKRQMLGLTVFAVMAMVGFMGFTSNSNSMTKVVNLHQTKSSELVPVSQAGLPALYQSEPYLEYVSNIEAPQSRQLMQYAFVNGQEFKNLRESYLERETLRMVKANKYPGSQIVIKNEDFNNNGLYFKSVKSTTPSYYSLQQLDDGSSLSFMDEENDTIVHNSKFLYVQPEPPKPTLAQTIYARLELDTTSVLCPNT